MPVVRVGVLKFGTVNWELEVIKKQNLDIANDFKIEVIPLGSKNATHVAIQGQAVDIIVTDWVWVSRQRQQGRHYTFVPYSSASGNVMVKPDSGINSLADLQGARFGVAGGPVDKSWVLLSAYVKKTLNQDLNEMVNPNFAAPPLINELFMRNQFDAVLNFWHYAARLESQGNQVLFRVSDLLPSLGIDRPLPMIGWVFDDQWAAANPELIQAFLQTSSQAKQILLENDEVWIDLRTLMKADDEQMADKLRDAFRAGIPGCFNKQDLNSMSTAYSLLARYGSKEFKSAVDGLAPGTVWENSVQSTCE